MYNNKYHKSNYTTYILVIYNCSLGIKILPEEQHCEIAGVILKESDIQLITVYRSPSGDFVRLLNIILNVLNKVSTCRSTIITGDFNVHFNEKDDQVVKLCSWYVNYIWFPLVYL